MQIVRLIAQEHMNNKQYVGKADFLVFRTLNQHGFLGQLQEKKLCAVIQLPSQTLLLSVSDKAGCLIGMLFHGVSFGVIGLGVGGSLLLYGFGAYFNILPGSEGGQEGGQG